MSIARICYIGLVAALYCGCGHSNPDRTRAAADEEMIQRLLENNVPGYLRTVSIQQYIWANPTNTKPDWYNTNDYDGYRAAVEFANASGGVERTNLIYRIFEFDVTNSADGSAQVNRAATLDPVILAQRNADAHR